MRKVRGSQQRFVVNWGSKQRFAVSGLGDSSQQRFVVIGVVSRGL